MTGTTAGLADTGQADDTDPPSTSEEPPEPPARRCVADLADRTGRLGREERRWLLDRLHALLDHLGLAGELRVAVVDDATIAAAHVRHLGVEGTTDVLTFDLAQGAAARGEPLDADLLVCLDEAERQARARTHERRHELLLYALHGVLHCTGYDDADRASADRMHLAEDSALRAVGVGAVYADHAPSGGCGP